MKKKNILNSKRALALSLSLLLMAGPAGCGSKEAEKKEDTGPIAKAVEKTVFTEKDLEGVVTGISDRYVLQNAAGIDYLHNVSYDKSIVRELTVDAKEVKMDKPGVYKVTYTATIDKEALSSTQTKSINGSSEERKEDAKVDIYAHITVVDKEKAESLVKKGEVVWGDNNRPVTKTKETVAKETETAEANPKNTVAPEKPKDKSVSKSEEPRKPKSKSVSKQEKPRKPSGNSGSKSKPSKPAHKHSYSTPITKKVKHAATGHYEKKWVQDKAAWEEPIYATKVVCGCGKQFESDNTWERHSINGCPYGYSVKNVQVDTKHHKATGHYEKKWVQDKASWTETVTVGHKCSCGATKK